MSTLTFFKQTRADGGIRTGINVDGETLLHRFQRGSEQDDPVLQWYIDVRCEGDGLPDTPAGVKKWLLKRQPEITAALRELATELEVGVDPTFEPFRRAIHGVNSPVTLTIVISATRMTSGRSIAAELKKLGNEWENHLRALKPLKSISD